MNQTVMKLLPKRYISFPCPLPAMRSMCGDLVPSEESVALWLGAWPRLLGWQRSINWLSLGVLEPRRKSIDDLWGMDSIGSLLLANMMIDLGDEPDPFENFVQYVKSASMKRQFAANALRVRYLKQSRRNSFAQEAIRQLQLAYCGSFVPLIGSDIYQQSIESALEIRDAVGNPPPVFVGVVASIRPDFRLSEKAVKNFEVLQNHLGSERVLLRVIRARVKPGGLFVIESRSPESDNVARVVTRMLT